MYAGDDRRLPLTLLAGLEAERTRESEALVQGIAKTFDDYRWRVGKIQGLTSAIELCKNAMKDSE